jgi:hypothetical protein
MVPGSIIPAQPKSEIDQAMYAAHLIVPTLVAKADPLQLHGASTGQSLGGVDPSTLEPDFSQALKNGAEVPGCVQDGPRCGLYADEMAMDKFHMQDPHNQDPLVEPADANRADSHGAPTYTPGFLLPTAIKDGFTTQGEMFYASNLASLTQQFGDNAQVWQPLTSEAVRACTMDRHHPALVPFDVDEQGNPGLYNGLRAHWCAVEAVFPSGSTLYVAAKHGWQLGDFAWRADDLIASSQQLNVSNFPGAPADIQTTLANRFVEIWAGPVAGG